MKIHLASHYGMCFGVRDAIETTMKLAAKTPATVLGELVHNPVVATDLESVGIKSSSLQSPKPAPTPDVVITAHGASNRDRRHWQDLGHRVTDTTCPLVHRAHEALARLVDSGHHPVVVGHVGHVEVRGLVGDFPGATVIEGIEDIPSIPDSDKIGIISQTTQPIDHVQHLVSRVRSARPSSKVTFEDTVCQPTKNRQQAIHDLCNKCDVIIVVGGSNSNNTHQLVVKVRSLGKTAYHIEGRGDLEPAWFNNAESVGITAGTSTLPKTVDDVRTAIEEIARRHTPENRDPHPTPAGS